MGGGYVRRSSDVNVSSSVNALDLGVSAPPVRRNSMQHVNVSEVNSVQKPSLYALDLATTPDMEKKLAKLEGRKVNREKLQQYSPEVIINNNIAPSAAVQVNMTAVEVNKFMNGVIKKSSDNDPTVIDHQNQMAIVMGKSIDPVLKALARVNTQAAKELCKDLNFKGPLNTQRIEELLNSKDPFERRAGEKALKAISKLCMDAPTLNAAIRKSNTNVLSSHKLPTLEVQTQFIKSARSLVTNEYFENVIAKDLQEGVSKLPLHTKLPKPIDNYIANVGFNRLMSDNNLQGASLSSDVDFKLVLDDESLKEDLTKKLTKQHFQRLKLEGKNDIQANAEIQKMVNEDVAAVKDEIKNVLLTSKGKIEKKFEITVEVASFTVKTIGDIREQSSTSEVEQNFLATVLHSHSFMSGNENVKNKFIGIIQENLQFREVASRNFNQNLGDSDKGSIKAIKNLAQLETVVNKSVAVIINDPLLKGAFIDELNAKKGKDKDLAALIKDKDLSDSLVLSRLIQENPGIMKAGLTHHIKEAILLNEDISTSLGKVDMFKSSSTEDKLGLAFKLTGSFTKNIDGEINRSFIGRPDVTPDDNWIYSVKYAGCRLNDTFDATPKSVFVLNDKRDFKTASELYDNSQKVAEALNTFAIQLQNRTYEMGRASGKTHAQLDEAYDRLTGDEFAKMAKDPDAMPKLQLMMDSLVDNLGTNLSGVIGEDVNKVKEIKEFFAGKTEEEIARIPDGELKQKGHELFTAMFNIAEKTANQLQPQPITEEVPQLRSQTI
jgi:hypothetical protein